MSLAGAAVRVQPFYNNSKRVDNRASHSRSWNASESNGSFSADAPPNVQSSFIVPAVTVGDDAVMATPYEAPAVPANSRHCTVAMYAVEGQYPPAVMGVADARAYVLPDLVRGNRLIVPYASVEDSPNNSVAADTGVHRYLSIIEKGTKYGSRVDVSGYDSHEQPPSSTIDGTGF